MGKVKKTVTVSVFILAAAVFSIFYAVGIPFAVRTVFIFFGLTLEEWIVFLAVLIINNSGTYVFVAGVPNYLLRQRNFLIQSLALISSNTVASLTENFLVKRPTDDGNLSKMLWLENPVIAVFYVCLPFIVVAYIGVKSARGKKSEKWGNP